MMQQKYDQQPASVLDLFLPYQKEFFLAHQKRKIWLSGRQLGKSFTLAGTLVFQALEKAGGLSLCISTGARAASEIVKKCVMFAEAVKRLSKGKITYTAGYDHVAFSTGSRVMSLPSSCDGASLRGYSARCVAIDEAGFIPHLEDILQAIAPALTRDKDAVLLLASTPSGKNSAFWRMFQTAQFDSSWHCQQTTVHDAVAQGLDVDIEALHKLCPDPSRFAQEYECKFAEEDSEFVQESQLKFGACCPFACTQKFVGMDIGRTSDKTAIAVLASNGIQFWLEDLVLLSNCPYAQQKAKLQELHQCHHFAGGYIDAGGIGSAFAEDIESTLSRRIKPFWFTSASKTPAYEALRAAVFDSKMSFNQALQKQVVDDFQNLHRVVADGGRVSFEAGRGPNGHSDGASAIVLALRAAHDFKTTTMKPFSIAMPSRF